MTARTVLSAERGASHIAQYDCLDSCVVICSRYEGAVPPGGATLVRTSPKLDVDISLMPTYAFRGRGGTVHSGTLVDRPRESYFGARAWGGPDGADDLDPDCPYMMVLSPDTRAKVAVVYPFYDDLWLGRSKFLQLYTDGGNYWYTSTGASSSLNKDFVVCLYTDATPDASALEGRIAAIIADAEAAVAAGEVTATIKKRPRPEDGPLYLVNYDHAVGYPKIQEEARKSVSFLDRYPELKVGLQAEGWTWDWLAENDPAFVEEARGWLSRYPGRWVPGGGSYGQPYFTFVSEESGIRQMLYGTRAIKEHLGYDNAIYIYSEHETMPQLPQILAGMGYRGAFFRTHMGYGGDGPSIDADWVRWIGPDGSGIRAVPAYTGREHGWGNEWLIINYKPGIYWHGGPPCTWDDMDDFKVEMLARGVRNPVVSRCEDWYTRPSVELLDDARAHENQNTHWVTAEDYFGILEASGLAPVDFAVGPNDFAPLQPWGYAGNRTWTGPRMASASALTAEALAVLASRRGFAWGPEHQTRIDRAWKSLLIAEHHDSLICAIYNEGRDFTDPSLAESRALSEELGRFVAERTSARGPTLFVFNPTGRMRTEGVTLRDGRKLLARDVPALGYRVVDLGLVAAPSPTAERAVESERFRLEFAAEGGLARLYDEVTDREYVAAGLPTGALDGLIGSVRATSAGTVAVTDAGPGIYEAVERGEVGGIPYSIAYRLADGCPRIDVHIRLDIPPGTRIGCPESKGTPEERRGGQFRDHSVKLRYVLDTVVGAGGRSPRAVRHQPLIIAEMPPGQETVDANLWASVEADDCGLAVANRGSMGYRVRGGTIEMILAYSGEYVWGDKFLDGTYDYDFSLIPYGGPSDRGRMHQEALAFDRPLFALEFDGVGGALPMEGAAIPLPDMDAAVTVLALFPQDGRRLFRLCNMSGEPRTITIPGLAGETNLALGPALPVGGAVELHPWRAQTYELAP